MRPLKIIICVIFSIITSGSILNAQIKVITEYSEDYRCGKAINQYVFNIIDSIICHNSAFSDDIKTTSFFSYKDKTRFDFFG